MRFVYNNSTGNFDFVLESESTGEKQKWVSDFQHTLYNFGRADISEIKNIDNREGYCLDYINEKTNFSSAWVYFIQGNNSVENASKLKSALQASLLTEYKNGTFEKIIINSVVINKDIIEISATSNYNTKSFIIKI